MLIGTIIYLIYSVVPIMVLFLMTFLFWQRRNTIGASQMSLLMLLAEEWTICSFFSGICRSFEVKVLWDNLSYIGVVFIPVVWIIFVIKYTGKEKYFKRHYLYLLIIIPILTLVMVFTKNLHNYFVLNTRLGSLGGSSILLVGYDFGIWFWVHAVYSYSLILLGLIIFIQYLITFAKIYRKQAMIMMLAIIIPFVGDILYVLGMGPSKNLDTTTFSFTFMGIFLFIGMFRYKILDLVPVAREAVMDTMEDMVIVLDKQNRIIDINNSSKVTLSKLHKNLIGKPINEIFKNISSSFGKESDGKIILDLEEGKKIYDIKRSPLNSKRRNVIGSIIVLRDITALEETMKKLEDAKAEAESANKAKGEFLAATSHEIRTPLNGIIGMAALLENANLTKKERENLDMLQYSADSLLSIINDILDFSKIEAGKMELENTSFNLRMLVINTTKVFMHQKADKVDLKYYIDKSVPEILLGDWVRLRQIIFNLLSNAFKFTEEGKVDIKVINIESDENKVLLGFSVSDTGIGIPENKIDSLFQSFHQLDSSTTRKYGGTGLGLSIVKNLVELMDGSMKVESQEGKGSRFSFKIPFKVEKIESTVEKNKADVSINQRKLKILVAEDSKVNQMLMSQIIKKKNWEVDIAENGKIALQKYGEYQYDLILMDIQMPEMDGYETTKRIREREKDLGEHIPIIALTANATEEDKDKCTRCGMDDFLTKPIKAEKLHEYILKHTNC